MFVLCVVGLHHMLLKCRAGAHAHLATMTSLHDGFMCKIKMVMQRQTLLQVFSVNYAHFHPTGKTNMCPPV